jgi:hypothetical protein
MVVKYASIVGLTALTGSLNSFITRMRHVALSTLIKIGFRIQGDAQRIAPVDTGNMKASAFTMWGGGDSDKVVNQKPNYRKYGKSGKRLTKAQLDKLRSDHRAYIKKMKTALPTSRDKPTVIVGFGANYTLFAHEKTNRFLLVSFKRNIKDLKSLIVKETKATITNLSARRSL